MVDSSSRPGGVCPVCGFEDIQVFVRILQLPVHCNLLWTTYEGAQGSPRGDVELGFCARCGHIFNLAFNAAAMEYSEAYENSLHFSPRFQSYADSLAIRLIERYDLRDKDIIELGAGQGDFLRLLCELGGNRGLGFDPSYAPEPRDGSGSEQATIIRDFYSERYAACRADLVCCRHVLEHIEEPVEFLTAVRKAIGDRAHTVVYFEVPNALYMLHELAIWDIIYEHVSYFTHHSLSHLFCHCGFDLLEIGEAFAGQFLWIDAMPSGEPSRRGGTQETELSELTEAVTAFAAEYRRKVENWQRHLERFLRNEQRVVIWGAGSKGVTFLNILGVRDQIEVAVDINPRKRGMYIAGTGQQIVPPPFLREYQPDVVIVMNPIYEGEIRQATRELGLAPELICA